MTTKAVYGAAVRRYFPGMERPCSKCGDPIVLTEAMCRYGRYACNPCMRTTRKKWNEKNAEANRLANQRLGWNDFHYQETAL